MHDVISSILMPVWNRADIMERAIHSVLGQTFKDSALAGLGALPCPAKTLMLKKPMRWVWLIGSFLLQNLKRGWKKSCGNISGYARVQS